MMKLFDCDLDSIEGVLEEIVFYNPDNGYSVLRFRVENGDIFTVVGSLPPLSPGEALKIKGRWEMDSRFGRQFRAEAFTLILPATVKGLEKFLASGLIRGIGPVLAARITSAFGARTVEILNHEPEKLKEVEGIGSAKLKEIVSSWSDHKKIRDLIMFLQEHGVSTNLATKIYRQYGDRAFTVLKTNPYQLSLDIWGIGFKTADEIALKLGLDPASIERVKAFILYVLEKDNEQGHIFSFIPEIKTKCVEELNIAEDRVIQALEELVKTRNIVKEEASFGEAVYLPFLYQAQEAVVRSIKHLASVACEKPDFDLASAIASVEKNMKFSFSDGQHQAIRKSFERKILVITGGPGTGKTTIIRAIVELFESWGKSVLLAAPTGRAAKRLAEATGREAKTIHRLLEFSPKESRFKRNDKRPLRGEAVIIDEFSMVDLPLMYHFLRALPDSMRLIIVGDKDQLPSVGPGMLLRDLIDSGLVEVVRLEEIFRQQAGSLIVDNAHRVIKGESIIYPERGAKDSDFYFIHQEDETKVFETILKLCLSRVPERFLLSPMSTEIQVISPMYKGLVGVDNLNEELQKHLNPQRESLRIGRREFRLGDKVMQLRNDYEKDVYNGDIGVIAHVDRSSFRVVVDYYGRSVPYEKDELSDITLAYAISVHKAQGSEYKAVIMPLLPKHYLMLQRNLFYTALTRAKKLTMIIGSYKALYMAIKNDRPVRRNSMFKEKLLSRS